MNPIQHRNENYVYTKHDNLKINVCCASYTPLIFSYTLSQK
jgi:hypothetical protein